MAARDDSIFFYMFIGYNNTGKSSIARVYANKYHVNNPKLTISGYDPQIKFTNLINDKYKITSQEKGWWDNKKARTQQGRYPLKILRNALFVADDYRGINRSNYFHDDLAGLMEFRFEHGIDIIMTCHSPSRVLEGLTPYISHYFIFYTKGKEAKFEDKMENYVECQRANELMKDYMRWQYTEKKNNMIKNASQFYDEKNHKHTFPHIMVDTTTSELEAFHLEQEWLDKNGHRLEVEI